MAKHGERYEEQEKQIEWSVDEPG